MYKRQVLNIASGEPRRVGELLDEMLAMSEVAITVEQDPALSLIHISEPTRPY